MSNGMQFLEKSLFTELVAVSDVPGAHQSAAMKKCAPKEMSKKATGEATTASDRRHDRQSERCHRPHGKRGGMRLSLCWSITASPRSRTANDQRQQDRA